MFFVYIIYSAAVDRYYIGSTQNVEERLHRHNSGHSKSTKGKGHWQLVRTFNFNTRAEAMHFEKKIKGRGIQRFLDENQQPG